MPKSEIEIEGELESDLFESYFAKALKKLGEDLKLDGFRKGKIPESVLQGTCWYSGLGSWALARTSAAPSSLTTDNNPWHSGV